MQPGKAAGQGWFRRRRANATGEPPAFAFKHEHEDVCSRPYADGNSYFSTSLGEAAKPNAPFVCPAVSSSAGPTATADAEANVVPADLAAAAGKPRPQNCYR